MLKENVYLIFPAGYSGTYFSWAVMVSDRDMVKTTNHDPINRAATSELGGVGTSHNMQIKVPTHSTYERYHNWRLRNQPQQPQFYYLNAHGAEAVITAIGQHDPTGVFVVIHDNNDILVNAYGIINSITKWPTSLESIRQTEFDNPIFDPIRNENIVVDSNTRTLRNWLAINHNQLGEVHPVNWQKIKQEVDRDIAWYRSRSQLQPQEVNPNTFDVYSQLDYENLKSRVFEISCYDIAEQCFPSFLFNFLSVHNVINDGNTNVVDNYHKQYTEAQTNLTWFNSIENWQRNGILDHYLTSHAAIESQVIRLIFEQAGIVTLSPHDRMRWGNFYNNVRDPSWPACETELDRFLLPEHIQQELSGFEFDYKTDQVVNKKVYQLYKSGEWQSMSLDEINQAAR